MLRYHATLRFNKVTLVLPGSSLPFVPLNLSCNSKVPNFGYSFAYSFARPALSMTMTSHFPLDEVSSILGTHFKVEGVAHGQSHDVSILIDSTGVKWSLRIAKDEFAAALSKRGTIILKHVKRLLPSLSVPAVIHEAERYMLLEYMHGRALGSWNHQSISEIDREKILCGLADFLFSLWTCPDTAQVTGARSGRLLTYCEWLTKEVDKAIYRSIENFPSWGDPRHFLSRRAQLIELVPSADNTITAIKHGDMNAWNTLIDKGNLSGYALDP